MKRRQHRTRLLLIAAALLSSASAHADPSQEAIAQALFDEGKRLMEARRFGDGCPKLAESLRLDRAGGTMLLLAMCHEGEGKLATAWAELNEAKSQARRDGRADRETAATERLRAIEPRLPRLAIRPTAPAEGLEILRDGVAVGPAQWSLSLPVDPGVHQITARAPGKVTWSKEVSTREEGASVEVEVPVLAEAPAPPAPRAPRPAAPPAAPSSAQRVVSFVGAGAALVLFGASTGFAASASSKWGSVTEACPSLRCTSARDVREAESASRNADIATALVLTGGVVLLASAVLFITAPSSGKGAEEALARLGLAPAGRP